MKKLSDRRGQMTVEAILIITLLLGTLTATSQFIKDQGYLASLVEGPWQHLAGMIENGIWSPPAQGRQQHPHHIGRHGTPRGDE